MYQLYVSQKALKTALFPSFISRHQNGIRTTKKTPSTNKFPSMRVIFSSQHKTRVLSQAVPDPIQKKTKPPYSIIRQTDNQSMNKRRLICAILLGIPLYSRPPLLIRRLSVFRGLLLLTIGRRRRIVLRLGHAKLLPWSTALIASPLRPCCRRG